MKKQFLLLTLFACFSALAQLPSAPQKISKNANPHPHIGLPSDDREAGDVIYENDFSDFGTWMVYTESGTTPQWELVTTTPSDLATYADVFNSPTNANGFGAFNGVQYLLDEDVTPIDALLELNTSINCTEKPTVILEFFMAFRAFYTEKVFVEVTNNDWVSFQVFELFEELPTNAPTVQKVMRYNISEVAGGQANVRIRFRYQESGADPIYGAGYGAMVDDLIVREAWNYDQQITATYHRSGIGLSHPSGLDYYYIPFSQLTEIYFSGTTENFGGIAQEGAKFNVDIAGSGSFSSSSLPIVLPHLGSDSLVCTESFTPDNEGTYQVTSWFDSDNPEQESSNDTLFTSFEVSECIYGRYSNIGSYSSIGNVASNENNPFLIGNLMDIFSNERFEAVQIQVSNDPSNVGQPIFAKILLLQEDGSFLLIYQTNDHIITATENGGYILLYFDLDVEVESGQTILVLAGHYGGENEVRFRTAQPVEEQTVLGYIDGASEPFFLTNPQAIMIGLVVESCIGGTDDIIPSQFALFQNTPNPCNETTILPYEPHRTR
jgi:hypothetical protein